MNKYFGFLILGLIFWLVRILCLYVFEQIGCLAKGLMLVMRLINLRVVGLSLNDRRSVLIWRLYR
jgi:thiol:disulfide interchange protein